MAALVEIVVETKAESIELKAFISKSSKKETVKNTETACVTREASSTATNDLAAAQLSAGCQEISSA